MHRILTAKQTSYLLQIRRDSCTEQPATPWGTGSFTLNKVSFGVIWHSFFTTTYLPAHLPSIPPSIPTPASMPARARPPMPTAMSTVTPASVATHPPRQKQRRPYYQKPTRKKNPPATRGNSPRPSPTSEWTVHSGNTSSTTLDLGLITSVDLSTSTVTQNPVPTQWSSQPDPPMIIFSSSVSHISSPDLGQDPSQSFLHHQPLPKIIP